METKELSELAEALIEGYWILCSAADAVGYAIADYVGLASEGKPFLLGDHAVTADEMLVALNEVVEHTRSRGVYLSEN